MLLSLFNNGPAFAGMFKEHNLCVARANFLSQILMFMSQVLFIPEVFSPVRRYSIRTGEVFWGALVGKPILPSDHQSYGFKLGI